MGTLEVFPAQPYQNSKVPAESCLDAENRIQLIHHVFGSAGSQDSKRIGRSTPESLC